MLFRSIIDRTTGALNPVSFLDITSKVYSTGNEQGLLSLAFHPDYANNGYFYVFYNRQISGSYYTVLARYQVSAFPDTALSTSEQVMMTVYHPYSNHNGSNLMFGWDGYLYVSMGDGGSGGDPGNRVQNCDSLLGKILRLDVSNPNPPYYFSPSTNPFYGGNVPSQPYIGTLPGRDEIFNWGMRNPWRCSIDRMTGDKWIADVGQNLWEEIDYQSRCDSSGHNYGWKCYEGNAAYNTSGCQPQTSYTAPIFVYAHGNDCSVTGGYVYRGGQEGAMFGKYFFADYCSGKIWETHPNGTGGWSTNVVTQTNALHTNSYTTWGEDVYGELYLGGDGTSGVVYKIVDTTCAPTAYINAPSPLIVCSGSVTLNAISGQGFQYNWKMDGFPIQTGPSPTVTTSISPGSHTISVDVNNGSCPATSNSINIYTEATITSPTTWYCINAPAVTLSATPSGGTFSGPGIVGNTFDPNVAGAGTHMIVYTYADTVSSCNFIASNCILADTVYVTVDLCTGIEERSNISGMQVYPNPGQSEFTIEYSLLQEAEVSFTVTDAMGRNVCEQKSKGQRGTQKSSVKLDVAEGIYILYVKACHSLAVSKVIVQK